MNLRLTALAAALLALWPLTVLAQSPDWRTPAEISDYRTTPDYGETVAYLERIAAADPGQHQGATGGNGQVAAFVDLPTSPSQHAVERPAASQIGPRQHQIGTGQVAVQGDRAPDQLNWARAEELAAGIEGGTVAVEANDAGIGLD